jgi:hypothetical protein
MGLSNLTALANLRPVASRPRRRIFQQLHQSFRHTGSCAGAFDDMAARALELTILTGDPRRWGCGEQESRVPAADRGVVATPPSPTDRCIKFFRPPEVRI